jgi:hypothetical protein
MSYNLKDDAAAAADDDDGGDVGTNIWKFLN